MQIVDRYLQSVKKCLPATQADDIIKELSENIYAQIEDKESELKRSLTEAEVEAILKQHGHPLLVASRYRQEQRSVSFGRQIIGPALFPFYIRVLKFNLGLTSVVLLVIFAALFAGGQPIGNFLQVFLYQLLIQFAIVTLIFWLADQHFTRFPDRWDPRKPYGVRHPAFTTREDGPRIPRLNSASHLIALLIALFWIRMVQHHQFLFFGPAASFLSLSPNWTQLYLPINGLILLGIVGAGISLVRPDWVRLHWLIRVLVSVGNLMVALFLLKRGDSIVIVDLGKAPDAARLAQIVNQTLYYCIWFAVIMVIVELVKNVRRLVATEPAATPAQST
ncbi:MAG: putative rane protein [Candidatus Acidoferrum typicum]|nr:putative rane protein [Candidatus Acidoferrum typicum]